MKAKIWNKSYWIGETRADVLYSNYEKMLKDAGFCIFGALQKCFYPQGYTCIFLLGESHFAVHTFPEHGKTYVELSSCNEEKYNAFLEKDCFERVDG